ncbi:hypothetical protein ACQ4LE_008200 [Meloidogyne hapla]|uniref:KxDL domain-containing protein n=1 Tax=Meloidogyne hapla TaxID=6305 RepID=A0A1I8BBI4_MELHA
MDFTVKDTSECSSSIGISLSQDSLNSRIFLKAYREVESKSLISITETSSSNSFENQVDEQEFQKQLKFLNAYLDSSGVASTNCQQEKLHLSLLTNEIVSTGNFDGKFESLQTRIGDTANQINQKMERGYNELKRLVMKRIDSLTLKQSAFFSEISKKLEHQYKNLIKESEKSKQENSTCHECLLVKMTNFEKELANIRSIVVNEMKMNSHIDDDNDKDNNNI